MISSHIIKEDCVILYFDYSFEVGSFNGKEKKSILNQIYDYLKNTRIDIDGKKIMLMLGSTLVATLIYTGGMLKLGSIEQDEISPIKTVEKVDIVQASDIVEEVIEEKEETIEQDIEKINVEKQESLSEKEHPQKVQSTTQETSKQEIVKQPENKEEAITKQEEIKEKIKEEEKVESKETLVTIYRSNGTVLQIEMEEYIVGVVAAEIPASFNTEALKAQSVIARTYALRKTSRGEFLTDTVSTQAFIDTSQMKSKWGSDYSKYYNKIVNAVNSTKGEYLTYNGEYIEAVYHSTSNGYTEDAVNVWGKSYPYLKSVESSWDKSAGSYLKITNKEFETVLNTLGITYEDNTEINIISRNESGRVVEVKIGNSTYTGVELRTLLGLRSADFDIEVNDGVMTIITRGYGHGVGLSQYGANGMANAGYNYKDIINHYYSGVKLNN